MPTPKHCLIVEDHFQARQWLERAVAKAFDCSISTAVNLAEANQQIDHKVPELALIDLGLPDGNGVSLVQRLAKIRAIHALPIMLVVSTVMNDDESIFSALRAGADGYILKEEKLTALTEMLRGICDDKPPLSAPIAQRLLNHFHSDQHDNLLAPRERQVLQLIAKGFTVITVSEMLGITYHTAATYVKDVYRKLDINSRAEATLEASKRGLI